MKWKQFLKKCWLKLPVSIRDPIKCETNIMLDFLRQHDVNAFLIFIINVKGGWSVQLFIEANTWDLNKASSL